MLTVGQFLLDTFQPQTARIEAIILYDLHAFHKINRDIFSRMIIDLSRKLEESLLVMAMAMTMSRVFQI